MSHNISILVLHSAFLTISLSNLIMETVMPLPPGSHLYWSTTVTGVTFIGSTTGTGVTFIGSTTGTGVILTGSTTGTGVILTGITTGTGVIFTTVNSVTSIGVDVSDTGVTCISKVLKRFAKSCSYVKYLLFSIVLNFLSSSDTASLEKINKKNTNQLTLGNDSWLGQIKVF